MKYTIEGFSQAFAMTLKKEVEVSGKIVTRKIDCTDLVILRWFVDFYPNMKKIEVDGKQYAWLTHKKLQEDLPLVDITKRSFIDRMQKLVEFGILDYKLLKEGGTFSLYGFGKNYIHLIQKREGVQSNDIGKDNQTTEGMQSNNIGVCSQTDNKYNSIKNPSIKDNLLENIKKIIDYLNSKLGTKYSYKSSSTQKHIRARFNEISGLSVEDFYTVIDKKCAEWKGGEMEKYLRPETLFGSKFENYLNAPATQRKTYGENGIAISDEPSDLDGMF